MGYLFDHWEAVEKALESKALLLLDYDGTLTPIVERPELATLSTDMKKLLGRASQLYPLGIISGRPLAGIRGLIGLDRIYYAGNHGFEISGPGVEFINPEAQRVRPILAKLCGDLRARLGHIRGAIVEDKGSTASVHYRLVADMEFEDLKSIFEEVVEPYIDSEAVRVTQGKKVFEIRPNVEWDKGKAALWIIELVDPKKELTPFYVGDDRTDEDAFLALRDRGITILVSGQPKESHAKFFLKNVGEVETFLRKLIEKN